eukprot:1160052-Pelagomonas_calceolata.AAC.2
MQQSGMYFGIVDTCIYSISYTHRQKSTTHERTMSPPASQTHPLAQVRSISGVVVVQRQPLVCAAAHPPQSQCEGMGACLGLNEQRQLLACAAAHPLLSLCQGMGACLGLNVQQLPFACAAAHPLLSLFEKVGGCLGLVSHSFPDLCEGVGGRLGLRADGCLPGLHAHTHHMTKGLSG